MPRQMFIDPEIIDLTAHSNHHERKGPRPLAKINAVVLHQTSDDRGSEPMQFWQTPAHFVVTKTGKIVRLHPMEQRILASSASNDISVAVEFSGNFPTEKGKWWTTNPARNVPTEVQISAGRDLVLYLHLRHGIKNIYAHRQGYLPRNGIYKAGEVNQRSNCPGPDIWYGVGEWAKLNIPLGDGGRKYAIGNGTAIPDSWRTARVPSF